MSQAPLFNETFYHELGLLLEWRRDVRCFCTDPLPKGLVEELVSLASLAPSVGYSQPCRFVRVNDSKRRASVIESFERANLTALSSLGPSLVRNYLQNPNTNQKITLLTWRLPWASSF